MNPLPLSPADDEPDLAPLLSEPFARAWAAPAQAPAMRARLGERLARSLAAEHGMVTTRRRQAAPEPLPGGASRRWLYRAPAGRALRPGEPHGASLVELPSGARLVLEAGAAAREFLVLAGALQVDGQALSARDYLRQPGAAAALVAAGQGAQVFVRDADDDAARLLVRDAEAGWPAFAPGIRRRVLWTQGGQAALLYQTDAGAAVPQHRHGHDEECLMVEGELFLDDLLLQAGDYQLAPAGSGHRITATDTGVVLYAHGDLDLQFT